MSCHLGYPDIPLYQAYLVCYGRGRGVWITVLLPFKVLECLPSDLPWTIPAKEYEYRRDLRDECIFSIDPPTARDLDDALHCKQISEGTQGCGRLGSGTSRETE